MTGYSVRVQLRACCNIVLSREQLLSFNLFFVLRKNRRKALREEIKKEIEDVQKTTFPNGYLQFRTDEPRENNMHRL